MASRSTISFIRSLHQKKFRLEEGCFLVEGPKLVAEVLHSDFVVQKIYATPEWESVGMNLSVEVELLTEKEIGQVSTLQTPNKVIAVVQIPAHQQPLSPASGLHIMVDQVQDPGNLGTIIRIADWFGIASVICSADTVEAYNPKVVQATMGSLFRVPLHYSPLPDLLTKNAQGAKLPVYATLLEGDDLYEKPLSADGIIIMGNESRGLNRILLPFISRGLKIPSAIHRGAKAESLNVAVATGIVCAEFRRQFR